jgi:DNA-binding transcriptional LysR family regulator
VTTPPFESHFDPNLVEQATLRLTLDQLRTLVVAYEAGAVHAAAQIIGRDQSSVAKQLRALNEYFRPLCQEDLTRPPRAGKRDRTLEFTRSGQAIAEISRALLEDWSLSLRRARRSVSRSIAIGATSFTFDLAGSTWRELFSRFRNEDVHLTIRHIHTADVRSALNDTQLDLVIGGVMLPSGQSLDLDERYEFLEWRRAPFYLVSNLKDKPPPERVSVDELSQLPLILPRSGLITDFFSHWLDEKVLSDKHHVDVLEADVPFILSLLRSRIIEGCTIVPRFLIEAGHTKRLSTSSLYAPDKPDLHAVAGLLARRADRQSLPADHPLNMIWSKLKAEADRG